VAALAAPRRTGDDDHARSAHVSTLVLDDDRMSSDNTRRRPRFTTYVGGLGTADEDPGTLAARRPWE
jgi:hypothetical protein